MLAYILAIAIAIGSLGLYVTAFLRPNLHRRDDFLWSGVGLFYALVLWICAGRITGAVLLGQTASVLLLGWFGWQTMIYRQAISFPDQQETLLKFSLLDWVESKIKAKKQVISAPKTPVVKDEITTDKVKTVTETEEKAVTTPTETTDIKQEEITAINTEIPKIVAEEIEQEEPVKQVIETPKTEEQTEKKSFSFGKIVSQISGPFSKKKVTQENLKTESVLADIFEEEEEQNIETKTTKITAETTEKLTVEAEKIEATIEQVQEVKPETTTENLVNLGIKEKQNEIKPENKTSEKTGESDEDNPFKELTS